MGRRKHFTGQSFWARGYYVSTVGRDEETVRNYIKHQESEDKKATQKSGQSKEQTKSNTSGKAGGLKTVNRSKRADSLSTQGCKGN
jgi:hypothetical protein